MIIYTWIDFMIQKLVDVTLLFGVNVQMIVICDTSRNFPFGKVCKCASSRPQQLLVKENIRNLEVCNSFAG
jgi:hypothetical protein